MSNKQLAICRGLPNNGQYHYPELKKIKQCLKSRSINEISTGCVVITKMMPSMQGDNNYIVYYQLDNK